MTKMTFTKNFSQQLKKLRIKNSGGNRQFVHLCFALRNYTIIITI